MLHLIFTEDWTAGRDEILSLAAEKAGARRGRAVLLVPEQISHETERRLCGAAGDEASRYLEVLSFTRLASRVFALAGGGARKTLDGGGRIIAMAAAAEQLKGQIKVFASAAAKPEFLTQMVSMVDEFKSCLVTPEALRGAAEQTTGVLAQKLEELSLLLSAYDAICRQGDQDPRDRMNLLLERMELSDFPETHEFYIDGFSDFTLQEREILDYLIRTTDVTVSLVCASPQDPRPEFERAAHTAHSLLRLAQKAGIPAKTTRIPGRRDGGLRLLREELFSGTVKPREELREVARATAFSDLWSECGFAAGEILRLIREDGARFRDISVVCSDFPAYMPVLSRIFHQYGIPAYFSGTEDILHKSVISTVLTAVEAAVEGLEQEPVLRYSKSLLSPLSPEDSDRLENYARLWSIDGNAWLGPWKMHPDGLNVPWDENAARRLSELEKIRTDCIEPLDTLRKGLAKAENTGAQLRALADFLREIRLAERMDDLAAAYAEGGDLRGCQEMDQLWEILVTALEQMDRLQGRSVRDGDGFLRLLRLLLSQYDVGTIPVSLDQVTVGAVADLRRREAEYVFLLGAEEGKLPAYGVSGGVLTEAERETLLSYGVELSGSLGQKMNQELAGIHAVISSATKKLYLSTGGGQGAFLWRRLCAMLGEDGGEAVVADPYGEKWAAAAVLASKGKAREAEAAGISPVYDFVSKGAAYGFGRVEPQTVQALYGQKLRLSASQIDKLAECRFAYFMRYGLRAKERKPARVDAAQFGTFVHYVLENTARDVEGEGGFSQVSLDRALEIAELHMEQYTMESFGGLETSSQREGYLFRRNLDEVRAVVRELWEELRTSQFRPRGFEVQFGREGDMPPVELKGSRMDAALMGFVDRVDICSVRGVDYVRVVDYKTGKKDFDYCDILNGIGLQMLLYLFALEQGGAGLFGGKLKPAGVLYFPARMPIASVDGRKSEEELEKERRKELRRKGLLLKDEDVIRAMDPGEEPKYLSCKRDKEGEMVSGVATPGQWKELKEYIYKTVEGLIDQVSEGRVEPNPYIRGGDHSACAFCEYQDACHLDACGEKRVFAKVKESEFWEQIERRRYHE